MNHKARLLTVLSAFSICCGAESPVKDIRAQGMAMLKEVWKTIEKNYFDPSFGGVDIKSSFDKAEASMQQAQSSGQAFGIIAQALVPMNDSHTFFIPPSHIGRTSYGWRMAIAGDRCFITGVKPGSDAERKGVKAGDEVLEVEGFRPTRDNLWMMRLKYYSLRPQPSLRVVLRTLDGSRREVELAASIRSGKKVLDLAGSEIDFNQMMREAIAEAEINPHRVQSYGKDLMIYHMPDFSIDPEEVSTVMERARKFDRLIVDLRGNTGGAVSTLERMAGYLLGKDVVIAGRKGRKEDKPITSKGPGKPVEAKLVLLVDSDSASAAELLARAVQIEKRGTVIGDRTAGAVRQSRQYDLQLGVERVILYGVSVTNADLIMKDGKSLEHVGVTPDEIALNPPASMAAGADVPLSRAAELLGSKLSPEEAGKLFPQKWMN